MKTLIIVFLSLVIAYGLLSCECQSGEGYDFKWDNTLFFTILDKATRKPVLLIGQIKYNYDTVAILNADLTKRNDGFIRNDGYISLAFINSQEDTKINNTITNRTFYVYFNYQDVDTLSMSFKTNINECDEQVINYFKVAYNDSIYFDAPTERVPNTQFLKD
jgi:hypothetical protein